MSIQEKGIVSGDDRPIKPSKQVTFLIKDWKWGKRINIARSLCCLYDLQFVIYRENYYCFTYWHGKAIGDPKDIDFFCSWLDRNESW